MKTSMEHIKVDFADADYDIQIGSNLKSVIATFLNGYTKNKKVIVITDEYFENHYTSELRVALEEYDFHVQSYVMKGGKLNKSFNEVLKVYGVLETNNYARDSTVIALGGGVIGDLAGFVASTWYRGMNLIHVPTTLMGMVDSSVGGKVAINYRETINAVGNYYHPIANFMDIDLIDTLPERDYVSGLAEVVKCGLIADVELLNYLEKNHHAILERKSENLIHCIKKAIEIKVDHVKNDVKESGKRLLLNYGHTIGHALEMGTQTNKGETFRHGEGVSLGISAVLHLSEAHLKMSKKSSDYARSLLQSLQLPTEFSASEYSFNKPELIDKCMKLMMKDKKRKNNQIRFILIDELGSSNTYSGLEQETILNAFECVIKE